MVRRLPREVAGGGSLSDAEQVVATRVTLAIASRIASKP